MEEDVAARRFFFMDIPKLHYKLTYKYDSVTNSAPGTKSESSSKSFSEGIGLRTSGWVYHTALLTYSIDVSPTWEQRSTKNNVGSKSESKTFTQTYATTMTFLRYKPYVPTIFARRNVSITNGANTSQSKKYNNTYGVNVIFKYQILPSSFRYSHYKGVQEGFFPYVELSDSVKLIMRFKKYLGISKFKVSYDDNETIARGQSISTTENGYSFSNEYKFADNRILSSDMRYDIFDSAFRKSRRYHLSERFIWRHREKLSTHYNLHYNTNESGSFRNENKGIGFNLSHLLYDNLATNIGTSVSNNQSSGVKHSKYNGRINFKYTRSIPWGKLGLKMGHSYTQSDTSVTDQIVSIIEEPLTLTTGTISLLSNKNVDISTIVVKHASLGIIYDLNLDYTISQLGSYIMITRKSQADGGDILDGQSVSVDYEYLADPPYDNVVISSNYGGTLSLWKVWRVYYNFFQNSEKYIAGIRPSELSNEKVHSAGMNLNLKWSKTSFTYTDSSSTKIPKKEWSVGETLTFQPNWDLFFNLSGRYRAVELIDVGATTKSIGFNSNVQWRTSKRSNMVLGSFWNKASGLGDEVRNYGFSAVLNANYRALRGELEYLYGLEENLIAMTKKERNSIKFMVHKQRF